MKRAFFSFLFLSLSFVLLSFLFVLPDVLSFVVIFSETYGNLSPLFVFDRAVKTFLMTAPCVFFFTVLMTEIFPRQRSVVRRSLLFAALAGLIFFLAVLNDWGADWVLTRFSGREIPAFLQGSYCFIDSEWEPLIESGLFSSGMSRFLKWFGYLMSLNVFSEILTTLRADGAVFFYLYYASLFATIWAMRRLFRKSSWPLLNFSAGVCGFLLFSLYNELWFLLSQALSLRPALNALLLLAVNLFPCLLLFSVGRKGVGDVYEE